MRSGMGAGAWWGMEDRSAVDTIPFHSFPIRFPFRSILIRGLGGFGKGSDVQTHLARPDISALG